MCWECDGVEIGCNVASIWLVAYFQLWEIGSRRQVLVCLGIMYVGDLVLLEGEMANEYMHVTRRQSLMSKSRQVFQS